MTSLGEVAEATQVARAVMEKTRHTMLTGDAATQFALSCGFKRRDLRTHAAEASWKAWRAKDCEPNFRPPGLWRLDNSGPLPEFYLRDNDGSKGKLFPAS